MNVIVAANVLLRSANHCQYPRDVSKSDDDASGYRCVIYQQCTLSYIWKFVTLTTSESY